MTFRDAGSLPELVTGEGARVEFEGRGVAVFRTPEGYVALDDTCPHASGPLSEGVLRSGCVVCPWHGWRFDAMTGACVIVPGVRTRAYRCRAENGRLLIDMVPGSDL